MDTNLMLAAWLVLQGVSGQPAAITQVAPPTSAKPAVSTQQPQAPACDARRWQRLVGRTIGDLLTITLPAGTRIYRTTDPIGAPVQSGRLSVEIGGNTRVRRVYCS